MLMVNSRVEVAHHYQASLAALPGFGISTHTLPRAVGAPHSLPVVYTVYAAFFLSAAPNTFIENLCGATNDAKKPNKYYSFAPHNPHVAAVAVRG